MIDKHVTNLELSKKLKAAGVPQKSEYYWYCQVGGIVCDTECRGEWILRTKKDYPNIGFGEYISAYLSSELGEMLPAIDFVGTQKNNDLEWEAIYIYTSEDEDSEDENTVYLREADKTEANSRAKMLIHLLDNNLIKAEGEK